MPGFECVLILIMCCMCNVLQILYAHKSQPINNCRGHFKPMDPLNIQYSQLTQHFSLQTSYRRPCSYPVQIHDLKHTLWVNPPTFPCPALPASVGTYSLPVVTSQTDNPLKLSVVKGLPSYNQTLGSATPRNTGSD